MGSPTRIELGTRDRNWLRRERGDANGPRCFARYPSDSTGSERFTQQHVCTHRIEMQFGKGNDAYQRNLGVSLQHPNPGLGTIKSPPFYALKVYPGDIGASVELVTEENAQVLQTNGLPIGGLYACGNDMDPMMAGIYPGPDITLGPAMTFGFRAVCHAAGRNDLAQPR